MPAAAPQKAERPAREKRTRETEKQKKPVDIPIDAPAPEEAPPSRVDVPIPEEDRPFDYQQIFAEEDSPAPYAPQPAPVRTDADLREEAELDLNAEDMRPDEPETPEREQLGTSADAAPPYVFPPLTLLTEGTSDVVGASPADITRTSEKLVETLASFGVRTRIINTSCGPSVTRYELQPESGVKVKAIANLADDIALHLAATSIRMECPIPGKSAVGIELPNKTVTTVRLRDLIANSVFRDSKEKLLVCLGVDIGGNPVYLNIAKMPHLLVAGATGMGKSVCINSMIVSLLYHAKPDEVKLILIDPKKIEFSDYNGIPHLLVPVVTEPKKAAGTLNVAVNEMEKRFSLFAEVGARELSEYNDAIRSDPEREQLPSIVIIIDELADLMMTAPDEVETSICRIAQKARAAGIHLIIGTQRPSVDVITGLIKANVPSRIACTVASQIDSRHPRYGRRGEADGPRRYALRARRLDEAAARTGRVRRRQERGDGGLRFRPQSGRYEQLQRRSDAYDRAGSHALRRKAQQTRPRGRRPRYGRGKGRPDADAGHRGGLRVRDGFHLPAPATAVARLFARGAHRGHPRAPRDRRQLRCGDQKTRAAADQGAISGNEAQRKRQQGERP